VENAQIGLTERASLSPDTSDITNRLEDVYSLQGIDNKGLSDERNEIRFSHFLTYSSQEVIKRDKSKASLLLLIIFPPLALVDRRFKPDSFTYNLHCACGGHLLMCLWTAVKKDTFLKAIHIQELVPLVRGMVRIPPP
jgi:hypothetical protein